MTAERSEQLERVTQSGSALQRLRFYVDVAGDGALTMFDIDAFVLALSSADAHHAAYPMAQTALAGDVNADGRIDNFDIAAFVDCLIVGGCR
ncbi:MAG: hypothetical protein JNG88_15280 [Phycisphaerales bacterium]|nr:hypothetical protein [Phycisphaerales bacterium]